MIQYIIQNLTFSNLNFIMGSTLLLFMVIIIGSLFFLEKSPIRSFSTIIVTICLVGSLLFLNSEISTELNNNFSTIKIDLGKSPIVYIKNDNFEKLIGQVNIRVSEEFTAIGSLNCKSLTIFECVKDLKQNEALITQNQSLEGLIQVAEK